MKIPLPIRAAGIDVDAEHGRREALQAQREVAPPAPQEPVRQPIGLQRLEAFEVEQGLHHPEAGGIAVGDRHDVGVESLADRRIAENRLGEGLADERGGHVGVVEPRRDPVGDRAFQRRMIEDRRLQERRQFGLAPHRLVRLLADAREKRIIPGEPDDAGRQSLRHGELLADGASKHHSTASVRWRNPGAPGGTASRRPRVQLVLA